MSTEPKWMTARIVLEPAEVEALRGALPVGMRTEPEPTHVDPEVMAGLRARDVIDAEGNIRRLC